MTIAWVLGSRGLLGTALCRALRHNGTTLFVPSERFDWTAGSTLYSQITNAVQAFSVQAGTAESWEIYWAAGVGTMSSSPETLALETRTLALMLQLVEVNLKLMKTPGSIAFSSSAGAIYAGSSSDLMTENTPPAPTTAYAREKLGQEELISDFAAAHSQVSALIARISTIYGPGQATGKQQGLLTHIARRMLRNQPIQIYVPYDTIRDYIATDDAAIAMVNTLRITENKPRLLIKIIASEHPTTIAGIISIFKRITRRAPLIVTSASRLSNLYAHRVQFKSVVLPHYAKAPTKSLSIGIAQLMTAERAAFVRGEP